MKALLIALFVLVMGDLAINHGALTHATVQMVTGFCSWLAAAAQDSIFAT